MTYGSIDGSVGGYISRKICITVLGERDIVGPWLSRRLSLINDIKSYTNITIAGP